LAKLEDYGNTGVNENTIDSLYQAMISPYNSMEFVKGDKAYNYNNVVEQTIKTMMKIL